jgi:hypothetical protein
MDHRYYRKVITPDINGRELVIKEAAQSRTNLSKA